VHLLRGVAGITLASGTVQMARPEWILGALSTDASPLARHLFGTIGMFMTVAGGTLYRSLARTNPDPGLLVWAGLQKLGASTALGIGVWRRLFTWKALPVATFDLVSGLVCLAYAQRLAQAA
jgi:hypothetical protein